jgi:hypothetical protein
VNYILVLDVADTNGASAVYVAFVTVLLNDM